MADSDTKKCESCGSTDGPFTVDMVTDETICAECARRGNAILRGHSG